MLNKTEDSANTFSKRKTSPESIGENKEQLQNIINAIEDGVTIVGLDGKILDCNQASYKLLGLSKEELIGKNVYDMVVPEDRQRAMDGALKVLKTGKVLNQVGVLRKDNSTFYAEISVTMLCDKNGKATSFLGVVRDISERKRIEDELRQREQLYRMFFDNSDDGFIVTEPIFDENGKAVDFRFLNVNLAYERQTGRKKTVVEGKSAKEIDQDLEPYWVSLVGNVAKTGKSERYENYNRRTGRWYDASYFLYSEGQVGILFRDITERKKAEETLYHKERELNLILDSSPTIIFHKDTKGKIIQANRAFAEALKTTKEKLIGKTVFDLYSVDIAKAMTNDDFIVMASKRPKLGIVEPYESPTGLRWIRTDKIPILDENGNVTGIGGFSEEITEHKKAEDALKLEKERYSNLANSLPEIVFETDINGNVTFANARSFEITGYTKEDLTKGFDVFNLIAPEDKERAVDDFKKTLSNQPSDYYEYTVVRKDGSTFPAIIVINSIVDNGDPKGAIGLVIDITERKKIEKRMQQQERLVAIGQTAGMVGHDLRNPLQSIAGEVYLAKNELDSYPDGESKNCLQESIRTIEEQVGYMDKIVSDLQTFVRPVQAKMEIINLKPLVAAVLAQIDFPQNIQASMLIDDKVIANTDVQLLKRVLINLVTNAVQAMPEGGELTIKAANNKEQVQIVVEDTGSGIPEEIKTKIFTPLFTTKSKGQGFGLAVCKRVIEAQGGTITFESQVGKGTKFLVELQGIK